MKSKSYRQFRIVQCDTADELTIELNQILKDLAGCDPDVEFEGLTARVSFMVSEKPVPEDLAEEYEVKGVNLMCDDCPYFERMKKKDGTDDLRKKIGRCPFARSGITYKDSKACNTLFEMLNSGEVKLCLEK